MIVAKNLRRTNIAEYLIYMFQVEDLIRLQDCDEEKVNQALVSEFKVAESERAEISRWYASLCRMMKEEGLMKKGHLRFVLDQINELTDFHYRMLELTDDLPYKELYSLAGQEIHDFEARMPYLPETEMEVMLYALYTFMLMKLKKMSITPETQTAMTHFGNLLSYLTKKYHAFEKGEWEL